MKTMARKLYIDIETYSSENLKTAGVYRYTESPDFEILLIAYALDDQPIKCIDLTSESIPETFHDLLMDPTIEKHAHNAAFERICFRAMGYHIPVEQWHCSMIKAAYCGLPLSLDHLSKALKLEEKGKLATGRALIKYFCGPCKPTKTNGLRDRNLPEHDWVKWNDFTIYCINDVEAERETSRILSKYDIPSVERDLYILDQKINDRGVRLDLDFIQSVISIETENTEGLLSRMVELTGLDNPNSPAQLKKWLTDALKKDIKTLAKDDITELLETEAVANNTTVKKVLKLRQKTSKTSVRKYAAMENCHGSDGRSRGIFQFYGANRTGRWGGRLIQPQNLPRTYLEPLENYRNIISIGDYNIAKMCYSNLPSVLSQLIRTAIIPDKGNLLAASDFAAIEARVTAWLAGEQWRMDVFKSHGMIYEASAAMMFGVPLSEVTKGSDLRSKGKVAELALGYQGALGALKKMGGESMGLSDSEMEEIVVKWRRKSPKIVRLWHKVEKAAIHAIKSKKEVVLHDFQRLKFKYDGTALTIRLPSGRKLFYWQAELTTGKFGECVRYKGLDQKTRKWWWVDTYGGKFVENIVQAISRDLLGHALLNLDREGYDITMHVHDEIIAEVPEQDSEKDFKRMNEILARDVVWAPGLPLIADGYLSLFYKKD